MPTINEKIKNLYIAINNVVAEIGKEGQIDSRHKLTEELMHALFDIDGGECKPELLDHPDAEPVAYRQKRLDSPVYWFYGSDEILPSATHEFEPLYTRPPALKPIDSADLAEIRKEYGLNGAITIDGTLKLIKGVQHAFCKKNGLSLEAQK